MQRQEVIIALTPHILPYPANKECYEQYSYQAAADNRGLVTGAAFAGGVQMIGNVDQLHDHGQFISNNSAGVESTSDKSMRAPQTPGDAVEMQQLGAETVKPASQVSLSGLKRVRRG